MGFVPPKYLWEDKGMGSNTEFLKSVRQVAEYYGCLQDNGKQIMNPGDNPITSDKMIDIICGNANVEPIKDTYGMVYYRPTHEDNMELKAKLSKPYSEEDRLDFIVEQNHQNGFEVRETTLALEAWGYKPTIKEIKKERLFKTEKERKNKAIIGQEQQEINIWNKQIIPVKLYKYLRTKLK